MSFTDHYFENVIDRWSSWPYTEPIKNIFGDTEMAQGNMVAKHMNKTSRAATHRDRRKDEKRGYRKHAKTYAE